MDGIRLILITVPPPGVVAELSALRATCSGVSSSHAAAAYPPHVTLRTGALGRCRSLRPHHVYKLA